MTLAYCVNIILLKTLAHKLSLTWSWHKIVLSKRPRPFNPFVECVAFPRSSPGSVRIFLSAGVEADDTQMKTDISLKFCFMSWQWAFWVFDDGWVFICKFRAICINLVSFQAFCISEHHIWLYNVPIPDAWLYFDSTYAGREDIRECHRNFLAKQSEVPSHLEARDWPCWFLRLLSLDFMILWHLFPKVVNLKSWSQKAIKSIHPPPKIKQYF